MILTSVNLLEQIAEESFMKNKKHDFINEQQGCYLNTLELTGLEKQLVLNPFHDIWTY